MAKKQNKGKEKYVEPKDYFSKELRKKYGLGEFAKEDQKDISDDELRQIIQGNKK